MQNIRCKSRAIVIRPIVRVVGFKWLTSCRKDRLSDMRNGRLFDMINESRSSRYFDVFGPWLATLRGWKNAAAVEEEGCESPP